MADENTPEGELQSAEEISAARREFLSTPPEIIDPEPAGSEPVVDEAAEAEAALAELNKPPAGSEGAPAEGAPAPAPAPAGTDPFAEFGGIDAARTNAQVVAALRTPEGVRAAVANGLVQLGYSVEQVRAALANQPAEGAAPVVAAPAADDPLAGLEDDDEVTVSQVRTLVQQAAAAAAAQALAGTQQQLDPVREILQQQQVTAVRSTTDQAVIEILGQVPTDPEELKTYQGKVDAIVARGAAYYDPDQWNNPAHIREAVVRANAEIEAENDARFKAYLETKRRARDNQPANIGGGAGSEGPLPEPKNLVEARKQARDSGFFD